MRKKVLVVPCYNEESRLDGAAFLSFLGKHPETAIIFVNDGSTDRTDAVLEELVSRNQVQAQVLSLSKNIGKAEAIRQGFQKAFSLGVDQVGYWDADLATPLEAAIGFFSFLEARPDLEIVLGSRVKLLGRVVERTYSRHYLGRVFATAASMALFLGVYDTQCGAKVFRNTPAIRELFQKPFVSRWIFDVEILARYLFEAPPEDRQQKSKKIFEYPLNEWREIPGSKIKWTDFFVAIIELLKICTLYPLWRQALLKK
jgi:dolichyl-phosphate beta-glucosyltransferase